jgi:hypothetical protein
MQKNVKSLPENTKWFDDAAFLVSYSADLTDETIRVFVIDFVPGKFWRFLGRKTKRRIFRGAGKKWCEIVEDKEFAINDSLSNVLCAGYINNENRVRLIKRFSRRKEECV